MKKSLLLSAAMVAAGTAFAASPILQKADASEFLSGPKAPAKVAKAQTRSDAAMETIDFSYAGDPESSYSLNGATGGKTRVYLGFIMYPDDIEIFAGSSVTGFSFYSPTNNGGTSNSITDVRFFYSTDPDMVRLDYTQDFTIGKSPSTLNSIKIDEPYTITGEEEKIFFGYSFVVPTKNDMYYLVTDGVPTSDLLTGVYGMSNDENIPQEFYTYADQIGALCMSVKLEREELPKFINFTKFPATLALPLGETSSYPVTLKATSGSPVESFDLVYALGGQTYECAVALDTPVGAGAARPISFSIEFPALSEKINEDVTFSLTKINGIENVGKYNTAEARVAVVDKLPVKQTLVEEYTGTWCPWCTRGYAAMEYIKKNYPEFVTAAYHDNDPMAVLTQGYPASISGFPSASLDRDVVYDPYYGSDTYDFPVPIVGNILAMNAVPTAWQISASHEWESADVLVAKADVANVAGFKDREFEIAYLLIADGLSGTTQGWTQANNYASYSPSNANVEELNAFCRGGIYGKSSVVGLVFNDVVISGDGVFGIPGSIPTSVEPYQAITHSRKFDLSKISSDLIADRNKLRVVVAVLDEYGSVLNSAKDEVDDYEVSAVDGISAAGDPVEYFNLNGMKVSEPTEGIFIRRQGAKAEKVIVK